MMPSQSPFESLTSPATLTDQETDSLAHEMARAYRRMAAFYRDQLKLAGPEADAQALEWQSRPWQRARFLAIRDSFAANTPPRNGIEAALLDTAAEAFGDYLEWSEHLHMQASSEVESERSGLERDRQWRPSRLSMAEAIEQSSKLAERAHARFLRTVKMLHELQRSTPTLYVGSAGQINVGQQQVNMSASTVAKTSDSGPE
jgi:hypothetical protein